MTAVKAHVAAAAKAYADLEDAPSMTVQNARGRSGRFHLLRPGVVLEGVEQLIANNEPDLMCIRRFKAYSAQMRRAPADAERKATEDKLLAPFKALVVRLRRISECCASLAFVADAALSLCQFVQRDNRGTRQSCCQARITGEAAEEGEPSDEEMEADSAHKSDGAAVGRGGDLAAGDEAAPPLTSSCFVDAEEHNEVAAAAACCSAPPRTSAASAAATLPNGGEEQARARALEVLSRHSPQDLDLLIGLLNRSPHSTAAALPQFPAADDDTDMRVAPPARRAAGVAGAAIVTELPPQRAVDLEREEQTKAIAREKVSPPWRQLLQPAKACKGTVLCFGKRVKLQLLKRREARLCRRASGVLQSLATPNPRLRASRRPSPRAAESARPHRRLPRCAPAFSVNV